MVEGGLWGTKPLKPRSKEFISEIGGKAIYCENRVEGRDKLEKHNFVN